MPYVAKGVTAEVTGRLNKHKSWESDGLQTKIGELTVVPRLQNVQYVLGDVRKL